MAHTCNCSAWRWLRQREFEDSLGYIGNLRSARVGNQDLASKVSPNLHERESLESDTNVLSAILSIKLNFDGYPEACLLFIIICISIYF